MTDKITINMIIDHLEKEQRHMENVVLTYDSNTAGYLKYSELSEIYKEAPRLFDVSRNGAKQKERRLNEQNNQKKTPTHEPLVNKAQTI